jgi:hypothetical protein
MVRTNLKKRGFKLDNDAGYGVRTPIEIVCHISQLLQNCCSTIAGSPRVRLEFKGWKEEAARFYEIVEQLDQAVL